MSDRTHNRELKMDEKKTKSCNLVMKTTTKIKNENKYFFLVYLPCFSFSVWISINPHECRTLTIIIVANKMVAMKLKKCAQLRKAIAFRPRWWWCCCWWCALLSFVIVALSCWLLPALPAQFVPCCDFILPEKWNVCFDHLFIFFILCFVLCSPLNCCLLVLRFSAS